MTKTLTFKDLFAEDATAVAVNNVGGGQVAGLGVGVQGTNNNFLNKKKKPLSRGPNKN